MIILFSIAGAAALAVLAYNHLKMRNPDLDGSTLVTVQQLAAVIAVVTTAVEGVLVALREGGQPTPSHSGRSWDQWDLEADLR